jgi:hypothetical protein
MKKRGLLLAGSLLVFTFPCQAKSKPPIFADPSFNPALIDNFDIYVIDPSQDDTHSSFFGNVSGKYLIMDLQLNAALALSQRGYNLPVKHRPPGDQGGLPWNRPWPNRFYEAQVIPSEVMLSNPSKQWLQDLGDERKVFSNAVFVVFEKQERDHKLERVPTGRWTMLIIIDALRSEGPVKASLSLYLYDRSQATLLWHDHDVHHEWKEFGDAGARWAQLLQSMIVKLPKRAKH